MEAVSCELLIHLFGLFKKFLHLLDLLFTLAQHFFKNNLLVHLLLVLISLFTTIFENENVLTDQIDNSALVVSYSILEICQSLVA